MNTSLARGLAAARTMAKPAEAREPGRSAGGFLPTIRRRFSRMRAG